MTNYKFTTDWHSDHIDNWNKWLSHLKGTTPLALEVGSFEGRSALWWVDHPDWVGSIICVDPYRYDAETNVTNSDAAVNTAFEIEQVHATFKANTKGHRGRLVHFRKTLSEFVASTNHTHSILDFAYIDGSHIASNCLSDIIHAWPFLKPGGIMIIDDYEWSCNIRKDHAELWRPKLGIDAFLQVFETRYELIHKGYQVAITKVN